MRTSCLAVAILCSAITNMAYSQTGKVGECDLGIFGVHETKSFLLFDQELRAALNKQDAGIMSLLVRYPLRINDERGSYSLHDPASLQGRLESIFTPAIRRAVLDQSVETVACNYMGIMYGRGEIWVTVDDHGYAIETVNVPAASSSTNPEHPGVKFACQTDKNRLIVDKEDNGTLRYRQWNKPHSIVEKPDAEIAGGQETHDGRGLCAYERWLFKAGASTIRAEQLGCAGNVPEGAVGRVEISTQGKPEPDVSAWCF